MGFNPNGMNLAAAGVAAGVTHISVHTAPPDAAGSLEVAGGTYARQPITWAIAAGIMDNTAQLVHPIPAGQGAAFYGLWGALAAGTFYGSVPRTGTGQSRSGFGTVDSAGVVSNTIESAAHGLTNDMTIVVANVLTESLPAGLTEGTTYFVVGATTDTFQVSLTLAGAAVDITGLGELFFARFVTETFISDGNLVTAAGALDVTLNVI